MIHQVDEVLAVVEQVPSIQVPIGRQVGRLVYPAIVAKGDIGRFVARDGSDPVQLLAEQSDLVFVECTFDDEVAIGVPPGTLLFGQRLDDKPLPCTSWCLWRSVALF
ncbi:MAG: hypothetical protein GY724_00800 [Actinomycetia bacterium]|nr:hypothetical protein [Actinomycetes bacterium]